MKGSRRDLRREGLGAIAGLLAAAAALGVGQFVAGITGANGSPVVAVGQLQIDLTPPWLKNFAISNFGSNDKTVLVGGILVIVLLCAAVIGAEATRRLAYGMAGLGVFAVIGLTAAATRPNANAASLVPTLAATAAAAVVLRLLIPLTGPAARRGPATWTTAPWLDTWPPEPAAAPGEVTSAEEEWDQQDGVDSPDLPVLPDLPVGLGRPGALSRPAAPGGGARPPGGGARPPE